jgi:hypothetical protein
MEVILMFLAVAAVIMLLSLGLWLNFVKREPKQSYKAGSLLSKAE